MTNPESVSFSPEWNGDARKPESQTAAETLRTAERGMEAAFYGYFLVKFPGKSLFGWHVTCCGDRMMRKDCVQTALTHFNLAKAYYWRFIPVSEETAEYQELGQRMSLLYFL